MSKLIIKTVKPRNPLVAPARFRRAGQHGNQAGGERRAARRALERELRHLDLPRGAHGGPPGF